jgi:hypothetical protein
MASASKWVLAVAIAGSALAVGSVHTVTLCILTAVLAAATVLAWWGAEPVRVRTPATVLLLTGIGLTAYTAFQCVPMPVGWLAAIAGGNADVWSRALAPLHEAGPSWSPISLDPTATRVEVLKGVAYLLAFVTALRIARHKEGVSFLSIVLITTATALALAAILHPAFGVRKLYGLYEPGPGIPDRHVAPLMNPNQLAAYINLGLCLAVTSMFSPHPPIPRAVALAIALFLSAAQVWVASRGGVVTMVVGLVLVGGLLAVAKSRRKAPIVGVSIVSIVIAFAGVALISVSSQDAQGELLSADASKLELALQATRMIPAYPIFGSGRGTFVTAFPRFRGAFTHMLSDVWHMTFTHPENVLAQWLVEWGAPAAILGFVAIAWSLRPRAAVPRSSTATGAWAGLAAVAIQNFGDFSSEVPGVMLACVACAAIIVGGTSGHGNQRKVERWSLATKPVAWAALSVSIPAIAVALSGLPGEWSPDVARAYRAAMVERMPLDELKAMTRRAMLRHPSEPYLPFIVGVRLAESRPSEAVAWLGATLERAPVYGPAHLMLARVLGSRSPSQARLEYRLAVEQAPELTSIVVKEAPSRVSGYWDAVEVVPDTAMQARVVEGLVGSLKERLPATAERLDEYLLARSSSDVGPIVRMAEAAVQDVESDAPWCEGPAASGCLARAMELSVTARDRDTHDCISVSLHPRALFVAGDTTRALDELESASDTVTDRIQCLDLVATLANRAHDESRYDEAVERILRTGCAEVSECTRNIVFVARQEESRGRYHRALGLYRRAYESAPDDDELLTNIARLAAREGLHAEALADYQALQKRHPGDDRWSALIATERDAVTRTLSRF